MSDNMSDEIKPDPSFFAMFSDQIQETVDAAIAALPSSGGSLLAVVAYDPAPTDINTASAVVVDADAANLFIEFEAPESGNVLVKLGSEGYCSGTMQWALREGAVTVGSEANIAQNNGNDFRYGCEFVVTGLTPGDTYTYKWAWKNLGGGTSHLRYGGIYGQAVMEVWAAP